MKSPSSFNLYSERRTQTIKKCCGQPAYCPSLKTWVQIPRAHVKIRYESTDAITPALSGRNKWTPVTHWSADLVKMIIFGLIRISKNKVKKQWGKDRHPDASLRPPHMPKWVTMSTHTDVITHTHTHKYDEEIAQRIKFLMQPMEEWSTQC